MPTPSIVAFDGLAVGYDTRAVLSNMSAWIAAGESLLVIGHNGAGKTTLLRTLYGLLPPLAGAGTVAGSAVGAVNPRAMMRLGVRYLGQGSRSFSELAVRTNRRVLEVLYGFANHDHEMLTNGTNFPQRIGDLSIGQRRIEALHLLSAGSPRLFLLDEPLAGIDLVHGEQLMHWMERQKGAGISFVTVEQRFRPLLPLFEKALVIRAGRVSYYGPAEALNSDEQLAAVYL